MRRRSSAARWAGAAVLEGTQELLRSPNEGVRLLREQPLVRVDPAPADRDREHAGRLRGADIEWRVAHVRSLLRRASELLHGEEHGFGVGLVALRVLEADDDVERARE